MSVSSLTNPHRAARPPMTLGRWLLPHAFDFIVAGFYLAVIGLYFYAYNIKSNAPANCRCRGLIVGNLWMSGGLLIGAVGLLLIIDRLEYWWYRDNAPVKIALSLLVARIALAELITQIDGFYYSYWLYLVILFIASLRFGTLFGSILGLIAVVVTQIKLNLVYDTPWPFSPDIITFALGCGFAVIMAGIVNREKQSRTTAENLLDELQASHQKLREYSVQIEELATTKERNRLARDIHDSLGHYLTVINVQLEKAMAFRSKQPAQADQAVSDAKRLASEALQDVRRSVSALRHSQELPSLVNGVQQLVASLQGQPYIIELSINGSEDGFAKPTLLTLYRAAQEGLTNIQKHATASRINVQLTFDDKAAYLELSDNGCGFEPDNLVHLPPNREGGYGLWGLQERLELVGGRLELASAPGQGTRLSVSVPKSPQLAVV